VLRKDNGGLASARNHGVTHARGEFVLMLDADNVLRRDYVNLALEAFEARPELGFAVPSMLLFDSRTRSPLRVYNPLPFDRSLALLKNRFGDAGAVFRRSVFTERALRYDGLCKSYEDWALWMDLHREGVEGAVLPRVLYDYRVRPDSMMVRDGWPDHVAITGLLIQRHFGTASDAELELLVTLNQGWGGAALRELRCGHGGARLRYVLADKLAGAAARVPGVRRLLRALGVRAVRLADRLKGRPPRW
jgi:glycosyltransferase involved in cell wall biosynthesis